MASDKLHLSKKWNTVFIHLAAWSILFIFPLLFIERFGNINRMHNFSLIKFYIQPICIACIFYINYLWLIDKVLFRKKTIRFILYNLLLIVMANVAIYLVHRMVIPESILHQRPTPIPPPRPGFMQWQDSITLVLVVGLSAAIKVTQKWITTEKERKQLEQERTEAELKNLKNQLNPHFLFNTLNARHVQVDVNIPTGLCRGYKIAPLLFITLIENAFKHGTSASTRSFVKINMSEPSPGVIECDIENSSFPKNETDKSGSGIGLKNLSRQLELLYPGKYNLHAESDSHIYRSMLTIDLN